MLGGCERQNHQGLQKSPSIASTSVMEKKLRKNFGRNEGYHDVTANMWRLRRKERWEVAYQIISPTSKDRRFGALEEVSSIQELGVQQEQRNLRQALAGKVRCMRKRTAGKTSQPDH